MELQSISEEIIRHTKTIEMANKVLKERAERKARALADYDKAVSKALVTLKNGGSLTVEGETITDPPASYAEKIARGYCYKEKLETDLADSLYKNATTAIKSTETIVSALQSLLKIQTEV